MKRFVKIASECIFLLVVLLPAGCDKEDASTPPRIDISGYVPTVSRTSISGTTTSFVSGDNIGVYETLSGRKNVQFSYNGTTWSTASTMYWQNGTSSHTFYGYYPYNATYSNLQVVLPVLNNQTITTKPDVACDMLVAGPYNQARSAGTNVPLQFRHAFTLLKFNITMGLINTWTLKTITIRGGNTAGGAAKYGIVNLTNAASSVLFDLPSGAVSFSAANNTATTFSQALTKSITGGGLLGAIPVTIYAVILPGQYANPVPSIQFTLTPLIGSDKPTSVASLPNPSTFSANTMYTYTVQIGGGIITKGVSDRNDSELLQIDINQINTSLL